MQAVGSAAASCTAHRLHKNKLILLHGLWCQARQVPGKGRYQADVWRTRQLHQ